MKQILHELNLGNAVLIKTEDLPEFWKYVAKETDYYGFYYEYSEELVKIKINYKHTIERHHESARSN